MKDVQELFDRRVILVSHDLQYVERGEAFTRFRDPNTGKLYELRLKEIVPKKQRSK